MRIVYLHQYFRTPQQIGGTRSWEFSRRLAANGHEVHVVTSDTERPNAGPQWRVTDEDGVTVHWTSVQYSNSMGLRRRARAFAAFARRAAARAAVLPQDLVFATSTPLTIAIPGAYAARRNGVPMVFEVRDLWPELPIALGGLRSRPLKSAAWRLEAWAYRQSAHVIALSPGMAANIERRFPSKPITIIPNACDVEFFAGTEDSGKELRGRLPWLGDRQLILYAGTIGKANHTVYLPRVARALRAIGIDTQIVVLGSGGQAPQLRSEAADLGVLDQNFHIIDAVAKAEVPAWLAACDVSISTLGSDP